MLDIKVNDITKENILKWKCILNVSDHQLYQIMNH